MCEFCGCEDGFKSVQVILPFAEDAKPDSQEVLASEDPEKSED
ncbi:MAG: hypothetical protein ACE5JS_07810 [Nitrospinota bacterium]